MPVPTTSACCEKPDKNSDSQAINTESKLSLPVNSTCRNWQLHSFEMEMTCSGCAEQVKRVLNRLDDSGWQFYNSYANGNILYFDLGKIKNIFFEMNQNKVTVHSSLSKDVLLTALQKTGKKCSCFEIKNNNCSICHCVYYNIRNAITDNIVLSCKENMAFVPQYRYHVLKATITLLIIVG
ncbi:conserved domain protein [Trichinella spiralis]|uniref:hypothetical protein n=1 Tax=Trichinella spiralis TaxID=6334 RepID=UPI0001EFD1BD|nr:conserved domain protein [Trichinella spiralis]